VHKTRVAALLSTSLRRDLSHERNALDAAAIGLEQEDPVATPLEFWLRVNLSAEERPPLPPLSIPSQGWVRREHRQSEAFPDLRILGKQPEEIASRA
jgi:hypothetical protein